MCQKINKNINTTLTSPLTPFCLAWLTMSTQPITEMTAHRGFGYSIRRTCGLFFILLLSPPLSPPLYQNILTHQLPSLYSWHVAVKAANKAWHMTFTRVTVELVINKTPPHTCRLWRERRRGKKPTTFFIITGFVDAVQPYKYTYQN